MPSNDASVAVQNFLRSIQGNMTLGEQPESVQSDPFTTLPDLLPPSTTIPVIDAGDESLVNNLLNYIPPSLLLLEQEINDTNTVDPTPETVAEAVEALSLDEKKDILRRVVRSPQFSQSLGSLTVALRDGGLPGIGDALRVPLEDGGFVKGGELPIGGGEAVKVFLEGVKAVVKKEMDMEKGDMDTS